MSSQHPRQGSSLSGPDVKISQNDNGPGATGSIADEPARDSIYEAEGEQSSIERSQPDLFNGTNNYEGSGASNGVNSLR